MQRWTCCDCGESFDTPFKGFLHAFTTHKHHDIILKPEVARELLRDMRPIPREQREWVFWPDMKVELEDIGRAR